MAPGENAQPGSVHDFAFVRLADDGASAHLGHGETEPEGVPQLDPVHEDDRVHEGARKSLQGTKPGNPEARRRFGRDGGQQQGQQHPGRRETAGMRDRQSLSASTKSSP